MLGIKAICESVTKLFTKTRNPFPPLPPTLILCSTANRPGLSTLISTANITRALSKLGVNTEPMPDGSPNQTVAITYAVVDEIFRALKEDASIQGGTVPDPSNPIPQKTLNDIN